MTEGKNMAAEWSMAGRQAGGYTVQTPVYEGPLDLLLQLIERAELDITTLALAQVTDQYLEYIHRMDVPADEMSAFLVMAARLVQIKSEALLPRPPVREAGEENVGEMLVQQLKVYRRFKELANWLEAREAQGWRTYLRVAAPPRPEARLDLSGLTLEDLLTAAALLANADRQKQALGTVIAPPRITIREKIAYIAQVLRDCERTSFHALLGERADRLEMVVTFLALLELVKRYRVLAQQEALFGEIHIIRLGEWETNDDVEVEFE